MYISEFCSQLVEMARERVRSGAVSERELARRACLSQPHMHNVLKGIRVLSIGSADRLMRALDLTLPQVLWSGKPHGSTDIGAVAILHQRIGPGAIASFTRIAGYMPFPSALIASLVEPVAAELGADLALPADYRAGDVVLLDRNPVLCSSPSGSVCWVLAEPSGLRVRYVRRTRAALEASSEPPGVSERQWHSVPLLGNNILEIVRARIVWIGRKMEPPLAGSPWTAGEGD